MADERGTGNPILQSAARHILFPWHTRAHAGVVYSMPPGSWLLRLRPRARLSIGGARSGRLGKLNLSLTEVGTTDSIPGNLKLFTPGSTRKQSNL